MADIYVLTTETVVLEDHVSFTLTSLCQACCVDQEQVLALVDEGLLQPTGQRPQDWRFSGDALPQARRALRLARDLDLGLPGVALVMDLLAEIERLRSQLRAR